MNLFKILQIAALLLLLGFFAVAFEFYTETKTDFWNRDFKPDSTALQSLREQGYPASISRVVEIGCASRFNGDGEEIAIHCFHPKDTLSMKARLGGNQPWQQGLPSDDHWRWQMKSRSVPGDLLIDQDAAPDHFIHVETKPGNFHWRIIDLARSISYEIWVRT